MSFEYFDMKDTFSGQTVPGYVWSRDARPHELTLQLGSEVTVSVQTDAAGIRALRDACTRKLEALADETRDYSGDRGPVPADDAWLTGVLREDRMRAARDGEDWWNGIRA